MNKYLLEILKDANTIIIPGLGALTITNKAKGEVMFMPYLKHDDGKLSGYIAKKDGIDEADAKNLVAKYVREIQTSLDKGDSYDMFEFGTFSKNAGGDIEFENWKKDSSSTKKPSAVKKETPAEKETKPASKSEKKAPVAKKTIEKKEDAKKTKSTKTPIAIKDEVFKKVTAKKTVPKKEEPVVKKESPKIKEIAKVETPKVVEKVEKKITPIVPITPKVDDIKKKAEAAENETIESPRKKMEKVAKPSKKEKTPKAKKEKKKKGAGFWILIIFLGLLIGGGTYFGINYDEMKQYVPFLADEEQDEADTDALDKMRETLGDDETDDESTDETDDEIDDEVDDREPIDETPPVDETPQPVVSGNGPYHVIAGAFSSQANADRLAKKLQDAGLPATVIMNGGMHTVSMKSFASIADANSSLGEMKEHSSGAWVLYKQ